jgi:hypothetical protein
VIFVNNTLSPFLKSRPAITAFALFSAAPPAAVDLSANSLPILAAVGEPTGAAWRDEGREGDAGALPTQEPDPSNPGAGRNTTSRIGLASFVA